jgi:hypothetical protein
MGYASYVSVDRSQAGSPQTSCRRGEEMGWGRWFRTLRGRLLRGCARRQDETGPGSPAAHQREIQRLEAERERLQATLQEQETAFEARHTILNQFPSEGGIPLAEVDRRLANLRRIRQERLEAQKEACEQQLRERGAQLRKQVGP